MNSTFCKASWTKLTNCARSFILALFGLCSLFSGSAANASITNDVAAILSVLNTRLDENLSAIGSDVSSIWGTDKSILQQVQYIRSDLSSDLSTINGNVTDVENYLRQINNKLPNSLPDYSSTLSAISSSLSSAASQNHSDLGDLKTSVAAFKTQEHSDQNRNWIMLSNIWERCKSSGGGSDVLAANAWWATNSAFALTRGQYANAYPNELPNTTYTYSFPQFMSRWSSLLTYPTSGDTLSLSSLKSNWARYFGYSHNGTGLTGQFTSNLPYTWFDWMSDATRSNWVLQASALSALRGISNAVLSSSGSSSSLTFEDVLAANPWWSTNSAFARNWQAYSLVYPQAESGLSFPEAFSAFLSSRTTTSVSRQGLLDSFGVGGINENRMYTFDDWLAEWLRSNMVLTTSSSISNLNEELAATDYEEQQNPTNVPLPQFRDLIADGDTSAAEDEISGAASVLNSKIQDLSGRIGTPNAEIVLFPAMTVGGITVRETRASLDSPITQTAHAVCVFIWYVALFASLFHLASAEFAFYANLGRNWVSSHGFIVDKESGDWV